MGIKKKTLKIAHDLFNKHAYKKSRTVKDFFKCACGSWGTYNVWQDIVPLEKAVSINKTEHCTIYHIMELPEKEREQMISYLEEANWFDSYIKGIFLREIRKNKKIRNVSDLI